MPYDTDSRRRKTFSIERLVDKINEKNRLSTCSADVRSGWNDVMESLLLETGNFHGFGYLTADKVPEGEKPGIEQDETMGFNVFPDKTRIYYLKG